MTEPTHTPLPYECFQDRSYYDMWCVRRVNEREWGKGFHLVNGEEAAALRDMLNTRADSHHRLVGVLEAFAFVGEDDPKDTQAVWEMIYRDRVQDWFSYENFERARDLLAALKEAGR